MTNAYPSTLPPPRISLQSFPAARAPRESLLVRLAFFFFWCLVFTIPWENLVVIPGLGTVAHLVGYLAVAIGILAVVDRGRIKVPTGGFLLFVTFCFWRCLSILWSASTEATLVEVQTSFQMVAMVWLLHQLALSRERLLSVIQAYVFGTAISAGNTFYQYMHGVNPAWQMRFVATGFDPNELALMLVLGLPLSLYLAISTREQTLVWMYRAQFLLVSLAVLLTASRGPVIAASGILLFLPAVFFRASEKQKAAMAAAVALSISLALFLVPANSWKRLGTIGAEVSSGTLNDRRVIWNAGFDMFRQHPIYGVGAGAFQMVVHNTTGVSYVAHNTFLSILVELGLIGFGLFLALYLYSVRSCFRMPRLERALWSSMLVTLSIGIFSLTWEYRKPIWLIFGLISLQASVARRPRSVSGASSGPQLSPSSSVSSPVLINRY